METLDLEDFSYNNVNMTAFRMVDADDSGVKEALRQMERFAPIGQHIVNTSGVIQVGPITAQPDLTLCKKRHFDSSVCCFQ